MTNYNLCILQPNDNIYSETFIKAHIDRLPANIFELYGGWFANHERSTRKRHIDFWRIKLDNQLSRTLRRKIYFFEGVTFRKYLRKRNIHVVLAEYGQTGVAVWNACKKEKIPLIVHFHGFDAYRDDVLKEYRKEYKKLFKYAHTIVVVSNDMRKQLLDIGAPEKKIKLNPYGVDLKAFAGTHPDKNPPCFIAVGRFVEKKAPQKTIKAFSAVIQEVPDSRLVMIGEGPLFDECDKLVRALHLENSIDLTGALSHDEVRKWMSKSRAFVQHSLKPSNNDSEGTPNTILEASAMGLPIVATRHAGIKDAVIEGVTGYLVDEGDIDRMASYMLKLSDNPELATQLGKAGREKIARDYDQKKQINKLWEVIKNSC